MTFYDILESKANDIKYANKTVLVGELTKINGLKEQKLLKYKDILKLVDFFKESLIKECAITEDDIGKYKIVVLNNSINSIIMILALLKLGVIPVLIDAKNIGVEKSNLLPLLYSKDLDLLKSDDIILMKSYIEGKILNDNLPKNIKKGSIFIFSSGSEGYNPHYNVVTESELIKLPNQYGEKKSNFYSYVTCANISGLLTNLVNPLINDCTVILNNSFNISNFSTKTTYNDVIYFADSKNEIIKDYLFSCHDIEFIHYLFLDKKENDEMYIHNKKVRVISPSEKTALLEYYDNNTNFLIDTVMFPRNIIEYLKTINTKDADFSNVKKIYLTGGVNSAEQISEIRTLLPSIKKGVFTNLYGSTEANGVISTCDEKDLKTCYIDITRYNNNEIYYTYDKKNIFKLEDGISKKIKGNFADFQFNAYLSVSNNMVPNVNIEGMNIILKKKDKSIETSDLGIYLDNRLYVLGRKSDLLITEKQIYDIKRIEKRYQNLLGVPTYCVKNPKEEKIYLFICYDKDDFDAGIALYEKALKFSRLVDKNLVMPPVLLNNSIFPMSNISGKVSKARLLEFAKYSKIQERNFKEYYLDLNPVRRCAKEFLDLYFSGSNDVYNKNTFFPGVKASELDNDLCFTVNIPGLNISAFFDCISYLFEVIDINDTNNTMKLKVLPQIMFFTREEFFIRKPILNTNNEFKKMILKIIVENKEEIKTWKYLEINRNNNYTYDDLTQIARNFILMYIEYLQNLGFENIDYLLDENEDIQIPDYTKIKKLLNINNNRFR